VADVVALSEWNVLLLWAVDVEIRTADLVKTSKSIEKKGQ
jgi:hypothetical protein